MQQGKDVHTSSSSKVHHNLRSGYVAFRLLVTQRAGGALIGKNGAVQKKLRNETGVATIHVEDVLPGCGERIVWIIGSGKVNRMLTVEDSKYGGERRFDVSAAQAVAVRVYETVEECSSAAGEVEEVSKCRLLVANGVEIWKREEDMRRIERETGPLVRVLLPEMLPLCADLSDELIQITGDSVAIKKALIAVTLFLQGTTSNVTSQSHRSASHQQSQDLLAVKDVSLEVNPTNGNQCDTSDADTKRVSFSLICPAYSAGGLVSWEETVVEALEFETGASIQVSAPVVGCDDLVITVSAMENKAWQYSPAQNAAAHIFIQSTEDATRCRHALGGSTGESVTARLIIPSNEANVVDNIVANMQNTDVQVLDGHHSQLSSSDDKVIQIVGEYSDVHVGLFQVTWELRENMFSDKSTKQIGPLLPHVLFGQPPCDHDTFRIEDEIDNLTLSDDVKDLPEVLSSKFSVQDPVATNTGNQSDCDLITPGDSSEPGCEDGYAVIRNTEFEITIPANVFGCIYGKGGCNVAHIRQISGASVIIYDPSPGTDGKAIISGTPIRTQTAMSMLSAFINEKPDHDH